MNNRAQRPAGRRPLYRSLLGVVALSLLVSSCSQAKGARSASLLIVGDSVAAQAAAAMIHLAPEGTKVMVDAVQPGTAPCDWDHGFSVPNGPLFPNFSTILSDSHPTVVAFIFTGNPGLSGTGAGCVDATKPYDLSALLASYEPPLVDMATSAARSGALVYFEGPPPRNPAVPVGYDVQRQINLGFQGSPALASFYENLAAGNSHRWRYDDRAAIAVSTDNLAWMMSLPCKAWDAKQCRDGRVRIRTGGDDAVHLDKEGCGAIRFALGLEEGALGSEPPKESSVAAVVSQYGGCQ